MSDKRAPGRPPAYGTTASDRIQVRVTPAVHDELRREAAARGTDVSGVIRELIDERVEDRRPFPGGRRSEDEGGEN